jgi:hypothetical protein
MRLTGAASIVFALALMSAVSGLSPAITAHQFSGRSGDDGERNGRGDDERKRDGQAIFRYDTFGDEQLWTDVLRISHLAQNRTDRFTTVTLINMLAHDGIRVSVTFEAHLNDGDRRKALPLEEGVVRWRHNL